MAERLPSMPRFTGTMPRASTRTCAATCRSRSRSANEYVQAVTEECKGCHRQEYAAWQSGPHSATYSRIFLDKKYNSENMLMDDCLRCHGMHFEGGVRDLVAPLDRNGPWRLLPAGTGRHAGHAVRHLS